MTTWNIAELPWLPQPPDDFRRRCREVGSAQGARGAGLRQLAEYRLDGNQLHHLAGLIRGVPLRDRTPLSPLRLAVLSNATTDFLVSSLIGTAARFGLALDCYVAPYGTVVQE